MEKKGVFSDIDVSGFGTRKRNEKSTGFTE